MSAKSITRHVIQSGTLVHQISSTPLHLLEVAPQCRDAVQFLGEFRGVLFRSALRSAFTGKVRKQPPYCKRLGSLLNERPSHVVV